MIDDHICNGDIVIVEPVNSVQDGEIAVAMLPDGSVTLKRVYRERGRVRLQPANTSMAPIFVDRVRIRGRVSALVRPA